MKVILVDEEKPNKLVIKEKLLLKKELQKLTLLKLTTTKSNKKQ